MEGKLNEFKANTAKDRSGGAGIASGFARCDAGVLRTAGSRANDGAGL